MASSALATATAVSALAVAVESGDAPGSCRNLIANGLAWLNGHQNADGGWGDSPDSPSNLATTALCYAAARLGNGAGAGVHCTSSSELSPASLQNAWRYIEHAAGGCDLVAAISSVYGEDRTFAVPILVNCALAGLVDWRLIPRLPFELAVLPHRSYKLLRLHVVSYALPALIAIGLLVDGRKPSGNPLRRLVRRAAEVPALRKLEKIQPAGGGFLEAVPLTSFVAMALIPLCGARHPVARRCLGFIESSVRPDGSWAIDSNLSVWLTTNAVKALASAGRLSEINQALTRQWIADRQHRVTHPYTSSPPGAWAWTHLDGGVPDTDDTASAILALVHLGGAAPVEDGVRWLLKIQNADGGWPTFCRGWGRLPFDRSSPDLTAHAMRALAAAHDTGFRNTAIPAAIRRGTEYLARSQRSDGSWVPLWFGNQSAPGKLNPVLGTSQVLSSLLELNSSQEAAAAGAEYLVGAQNGDGGWGGARGVASSVEETALAVAALAGSRGENARAAAERGTDYLVRRIETGTGCEQTPIGLYFARLWYSEELYPVIWTLDALGRAGRNGISIH